MRTSARFAKNFEFFKIYGVSAQTRRAGEERSIFAILCERLLWTAPEQIQFITFVDSVHPRSMYASS